MKKLYIVFLMAGLLFSLVSCDDFLDTLPDSRTEADTPEKIRKLLVTAYPEISNILVMETISDNTDYNIGNYIPMAEYQIQTYNWEDVTAVDGNDSPFMIWGEHYLAIATANQALAGIEKLGDTQELAALKAEALLCRAYSHFVLVTTFCKMYGETSGNPDTDPGIPYMTEPETKVKPEYQRGSVAETYELINRDIEEALPLVSDAIHEIPKYHFTRRAAYAFAARFNLYYRNYDKVIEYADMVLGSNPASLLRNWEALGAIDALEDNRINQYVSSTENANLLLISKVSNWPMVGLYLGYWQFFRYNHNELISTTESYDAPGPWGTSSNFYLTSTRFVVPIQPVYKLGLFYEFSDPVAGIFTPHMVTPAFTTDETLLCRAEAYALKGNYDLSIADLNTFLRGYHKSPTPLTKANIDSFYGNMAYYTPTEPTPKKQLNPDSDFRKVVTVENENLIHCILHLRRILTIHEGLRWPDINRYGIEIYRRQQNFRGEPGEEVEAVTDKLTVDDPRRAFQLPADAINGGLAPNPR